MFSRRIHRRGAALAAMVMVMVAGCGDSDSGGGDGDSPREPTTFAVIDDAAAFDTTRTEVADVVREASEAANEALGGEGLRGDGKIGDTLCNEAYSRRFSKLEGGFTLRAPGESIATGLEQVRAAWEQRGWEVELVDPDRVALGATTSTGVPFSVLMTLQVNQTDPATLGASLSLSTRCLKLPDDVADTL